jgi:hypothetical protein
MVVNELTRSNNFFNYVLKKNWNPPKNDYDMKL